MKADCEGDCEGVTFGGFSYVWKKAFKVGGGARRVHCSGEEIACLVCGSPWDVYELI